MEACTGPEQGTMEDIIPSIINALSLNDNDETISRSQTDDNVTAPRRRLRRQQEQDIDSVETRAILKDLESNCQGGQQQQKPNEKGKSASTDVIVEDMIPSILNVLSFNDKTKNFSQKNSTEDVASRLNDKGCNPSTEEIVEDILPSIMNVLSFNDSTTNITKRNSSSDGASRPSDKGYNASTEGIMEDMIPSIMKALSFSDTTKNISKRDSSNDVASRRRHQQERRIDSSEIPQVRKGKKVQDVTCYGNRIDEVLPSVRKMLSIDEDDTKETQKNGAVGSGTSQVYPLVRNVFSMNDIHNVTLNTQQDEISGNDSSSVLSSRQDEENPNRTQRRNNQTNKILVTRAYEVKEHYLESVFYVSISAILGSVFRVYMARIFGFDCEYKNSNDFLVPFASNICVTNDGRSEQTGGALFIDFPSNVFGSFLMGMITPPINTQRARLPWLHRDHPLQRDEVFHASLGTGFCGCLTTFASWNTQMVVMLDGTFCELGSQLVTVLFGYFIGLMSATYGFQLGRQCGLWMHNYRHKDDEETSHMEGNDTNQILITDSEASVANGVELPDEGVELVDDDNVSLKPVPSHLHKVPLFLTAVALLVAFVIGDVVNGVEFYKGMTLLWILSPVGSLLRWKLSNLNVSRKGRIITNSPDWIPWGTLFANLLASVVSACMEGLNDRYFFGADPSSTNQWVDAMLFALKTGVAGSLSTVSTMVKETVLLSENHPEKAQGYYYSILTCLSSCLLGLMVYATTIRI